MKKVLLILAVLTLGAVLLVRIRNHRAGES
jgi:hypothetical protein